MLRFTSLLLLCVSMARAAVILVPGEQPTIQAGINEAMPFDTVLVSNGTYYENIDTSQFAVVVASHFIDSNNEQDIQNTIIDGNGSRVLTFNSGEGEGTKFIGFSITNGWASNGAGIICTSGSSPELRHLDIHSNSGNFGGGIECAGGNPILRYCRIRDNSVVHNGGGIRISGSSPTIDHCIVEGNSAGGRGGGIQVWGSSSPVLQYLTVYGNEADLLGGGLVAWDGSVQVNGSIFWSNVPDQAGCYAANSSLELEYCCTEDGVDGINTGSGSLVWGDGCISDNPRFVDAEGADFSLQSDSPCVNAGNPDDPLDDDGTVADMGALPLLGVAEALPPVAEFSYSVLQAEVPALIQFEDVSVAGDYPIQYWEWDFGDFQSSSEQSPIHTYSDAGLYTVSLTITDSIGLVDSVVCTDCIVVADILPPQDIHLSMEVGSLAICWSPSMHPDLLLYRLFRSTSQNASDQLAIINPPDSCFIDATALPNTTYFYRLKTVLWSFEQSEYSSEVSGQRAPQLVLDPDPLALSATPNTPSPQDSFLVANTGGGQLFYQCSGADTLNGGMSVLSIQPPADTLDATPARDQQWLNVAANGAVLPDGDYSLSVQVMSNDPQLPTASVPVSLHVNILPPSPVQNLQPLPYMTAIELNWDPSPVEEEVEFYTVFRGVSVDTLDTLAQIDVAWTQYTDANVPDADQTYFYRVSATDINGSEGEWSDPVETYLDIPAPVYDLDIQSQGADIALNWSPVDTTVYGNPIQNLTGYLVFFNQFAWDDEFNFFQFVTDTMTVHPFAAQFTEMQFYRVEAYAGPIALLELAMEQDPHFKQGTLRSLIQELPQKD